MPKPEPELQRPGADGNAASAACPKRGFHLFDENQSAEIERFRMALHCLADLSAGGDLADAGDTVLNRHRLASLFDQLEKRLADIIAPENVAFAFLDPELLRPAERQPTPPA